MQSVKTIYNSGRYLRRVRGKRQAGQSLLIALAVLFLLGFLGALFASIVVRNLTNAQTANDTINTDYFAQAGINYANNMLETSPLGADWRPPLQYVDSTAYPPTASAAGLTTPNLQDPDYKWLNSGYTRYDINGGRFLLKVTYNPAGVTVGASGSPSTPSASPTGKFIEIDSIGRIGVVNANDPTTYTSSPPDLRRSELIAYKPIGIVDYSRFITNKDHRTDTASLGVPSVAVTASGTTSVVTPGVYDFSPSNLPTSTGTYTPTEYPLVTNYGSATGYSSLVQSSTAYNSLGGGSLRSNMNLRLYGENNVYLNTAFGDDWEIAGNLTFDNYNSTTADPPATTYNQLPAQCELYYPDSTTATTTDNANVYPSNDTANFSTFYGAIRDGSTNPDVNGSPRSIRRLNPPLIDTVDPQSGLSRYQTLVSGSEVQTQQYSTNADYYPATVSINNDSDIQHESLNQIGGHTLRNDWLNHASDTGGSWEGSFYNPPGTLITLGQVSGVAASTSGGTNYGITLTRSDVNSAGVPVLWTTPTGTTNASIASQTLRLVYAPLPTTTPATANPDINGLGYLQSSSEAATDPTNVVIYASGNVRVRGIVGDLHGPAEHVTIVTNGIAYIDGSVLKGNPSSSIAILAKQYVCVNTTQFLAGAANLNTSVSTVASSIGPPPALTFSNAETLDEEALFGTPYPAPLSNTSTYHLTSAYHYNNYFLFTSSSSGAVNQSSDGDMSVNHGTPTALAAVTGTTPYRDVLPISPSIRPLEIFATPFTLTFSKDPESTSDWLLQKAAVVPGDIQIEAVLYAQDNSFFVIPGDWFNTDKNDTMSNAFDRLSSDPQTRDGRYPFYGQPIDIQITVNGAVSENVPADISDEAAWMQKWGWIPRYHGLYPGNGITVSTGVQDVSPHAIVPTTGVDANMPQPGIGLSLIYDHNSGFPFIVNTTGTATTPVTYLRVDRFGRPLPFAPSLPVSPDLLYSGQPTT